MKTIPLDGYYLPYVKKEDIKERKVISFPDKNLTVEVKFPLLTPELIIEIVSRIKTNREKFIAQKSIHEIISICDKVVNLWQNPDYHLRVLALEVLPITSGFSRKMVEKCITEMLTGLKKDSLYMMLKEELNDPECLDKFVNRKYCVGKNRAFGPEVVTHIFSGNVPALPSLSIFCGLLLKSATIGKVSSEEPVFPVLLAKSFEEISSDLASTIGIVYWEGGSKEIETRFFSESDAVVVYGGIETIKNIKSRVPQNVRLVAYGHKMSFGVIGKEMLTNTNMENLAMSAAIDVSMFDQQGCLSPHLFYVEEGGEVLVKQFAEVLSMAMKKINKILPGGKTSVGKSVEINRIRDEYEFKNIKGEDVALFSSESSTDWTVVYENNFEFVPSCLNRVIRIKPFNDIGKIIEYVTPIKNYLQTVGVALSEEKCSKIANELGRLGVTRFAPIGKMASVSGTWHHDGRYHLLDLIRWSDIEV